MRNMKLLILVVVFIVLSLLGLYKLFPDILSGKEDEVIKPVKQDTVEIIEAPKVDVEESIFGYIEDMDIEGSIRDPFDYPLSAKSEYEQREKDFLAKLELLVRLMELEKGNIEGNVDHIGETDIQEYLNSSGTEEDISDIIASIGSKYGIEEGLISSIISNESSNKKDTESKNSDGSTDRGLMQINSGTAPWLAKELGLEYKVGMEFDPSINIEMGAFYLNHLKGVLDDTDFILTAYNRGPQGAYDLKRSTGSYSSDYSKKVLSGISK